MRSAQQILDELGMAKPQDIDLEIVAAHLKALVLYESLEGCEANLVGNREEAFITVKKGSPIYRQRFSIGHELGHWVLHRGQALQQCKVEDMQLAGRSTKIESSANKFAAELLLPEGMFKKYSRQHELCLDAVRSLADTFRTSLTATALRLAEVIDQPAAVVCTRQKEVLWARFTSGVPGSFNRTRLRRILLPECGPNRLSRKNEQQTSICEISSDTWFNVDKQREQIPMLEQSRRISKTDVLTLLWWEENDELLSLLDDDI